MEGLGIRKLIEREKICGVSTRSSSGYYRRVKFRQRNGKKYLDRRFRNDKNYYEDGSKNFDYS